jgi:glycosyltransferase involved in cell wall biosynthesis
MRLHFSNVNFSSRTGPNTFACRLAESLTKRKHHIVSEKEEYDVFLCFIEPASMPDPRSKFIQRLDGIWFKPDHFETHNRSIKWAYDNSHHVVWQSDFDKCMTEHHWGPKSGTVIHNGIQLEKVSIRPELKAIKERHGRIFSCSANWHRQKRLKENIEFFQKNSHDNDALIVLGNNPDFIVNDRRIIYAGNQPHEVCLQIYTISDWFIHLAWLDHCPNVVVEALSQGCPVICTDSGGTKELVKSNGIIIPEVASYQYQLCDYDTPPSIVLNHLDVFDRLQVDNSYLDIEKVCDKYESIF